MKPPRFDETQLLPLTTDAAIEERIAHLVGRAISRQLWLMFLDQDDLQLPLLIPIDGLPDSPTDDQSAEVLDRVRDVMEQIGATAIVVVLERYGSETLTAQDVEWARSLRRGCLRGGIALRAQLLSHRGGVRWIAQDDIGDVGDGLS